MESLKHSKNIMKKTVMGLYHDTEYNVIENGMPFNKEACRNVVYTRLTVRYPFMKSQLTFDCVTHMTNVFESYLNDGLTVNKYHKDMKRILDILIDQYNSKNQLYLD